VKHVKVVARVFTGERKTGYRIVAGGVHEATVCVL
jgi:hypothetical protein